MTSGTSCPACPTRERSRASSSRPGATATGTTAMRSARGDLLAEGAGVASWTNSQSEIAFLGAAKLLLKQCYSIYFPKRRGIAHHSADSLSIFGRHIFGETRVFYIFSEVSPNPWRGLVKVGPGCARLRQPGGTVSEQTSHTRMAEVTETRCGALQQHRLQSSEFLRRPRVNFKPGGRCAD